MMARSSWTWGQTAVGHRIVQQLQAEGLQKGQAVSILGTTTIRYALVYLGALPRVAVPHR